MAIEGTLFNVFVDFMICHWVTIVGYPQEGAGQEGLGTTIQTLSALFCANDDFVVFPESDRLQGVFDALKSLFGRVGLRTN